MKNLILLTVLFTSFTASSQIVSGVYIGKLQNDSLKMVQTYELALSEYRGKIMGYAYTTFVMNDTFYYSIKKVKVTRTEKQLIVEDDKMLVNNFPQAPARRVHVVNTIELTNEDTLRQMNGKWETNMVRNKYYAMGGALKMARGDSSNSALVAHLKDLKVSGGDDSRVATSGRNKDRSSGQQNTGAVPVNETAVRENNRTAATTAISTSEKSLSAVQPTNVAKTAKLAYHLRKINAPQTVEINSDSIVLALYDNGVVDGDSISVYVNGTNVIDHVKLTSTATKKVIYTPYGNQFNILLVAENLGSIPPNTGLVVIRDGENSYQLNFSADMQTNASIVLRRKQ